MSARATAATTPDSLAAAESTDPAPAGFSPVWPNQTSQIPSEDRKPRAISRPLALDGKNRGTARTCGARAGMPASRPGTRGVELRLTCGDASSSLPQGVLRPEFGTSLPDRGYSLGSTWPHLLWSSPRCAPLSGSRWTTEKSLRAVIRSGSANPGPTSYNNLSRPSKSVGHPPLLPTPGFADGNHSGILSIRVSSSSICSSLDSLSRAFQSASRNSV
jgi:hypothetical protein